MGRMAGVCARADTSHRATRAPVGVHTTRGCSHHPHNVSAHALSSPRGIGILAPALRCDQRAGGRRTRRTPPTHTSHSPAQLARLAGLSAPPVLNTPIASRRASPSYPLLVLQIESVANHVVLDEFAYNPADGHLVRDEEQLLVREVQTAL